MTSLKILFLSHSFAPSIGGVEVSLGILAEALIDAGHNAVVMTLTSEDITENFPYEVIRNPSFLLELKYHTWADIVYENNLCMRLGWPKLVFRRPSVITLHTWINQADGTVTLEMIWVARAPTPAALIEKSGTSTAMREHGLRVVCVGRPWHPRTEISLQVPAGMPIYSLGNFKNCVASSNVFITDENTVSFIAKQLPNHLTGSN